MGHRFRNWSAFCAAALALAAAGWLVYGYVSNPGLRSPRAARLDALPEAGAAPAPGTSGNPSTTEPPPKERARDTFETGSSLPDKEILEYTGHVSKLSNVAILQVIADQVEFLGRRTLHLRAFARTQNPLRMIFALDDQFDSYIDAKSLTSIQFEMHLNERGQKVDSVLRLTSGNEPGSSNATATRVLPGTRDPLGMLQYLRSVNWARTPEVRCPVFDGHKLYEARARLMAPAETVEVPAGKFTSSQIELRVFENGVESKDSHFKLYLANNAARTPILLNAVLPFADARVELLRVR